jgi:hypothetical protein
LGGGWQGALCNLNDRGKALLVANREIRKNLSVDLDAGEGQTVDKMAIGHAIQTASRVDPLDPQPTHCSLAVPTVTIGILESVHKGLMRSLVKAVARAAMPLHLLENTAVATMGRDAALYSCHGSTTSFVRYAMV